MWIGHVSEQMYYNPTTNRIPLSVSENAQRFALAESQTNFVPGFHLGTTDADVATPWLTIQARKQSIPIVPTVEVTLSETSRTRIARAIRRKAKREG